MKITLKPPAKINLGLWVHGKRNDGFHELTTVFQEIPLYDELEISPHDSKKFVCEAFPGQDNLCLKAWQRLENYCGHSLNASVTLKKKIPAAAGLGGASADASYLLLGLNQLHQLNLSNAELKCIASEFGSDTAFFIEGGCQAAKGRGENLSPLSCSYENYLILAVPHMKCSTPAVFKALTPPYSEQKNQIKVLETALKTGKLSNISDQIHNDLMPAAQSITEELESCMKQLEQQFNTSFFLSGSGSSCFALSETAPASPLTFDGRYLGVLDLKNNNTVWEICQ